MLLRLLYLVVIIQNSSPVECTVTADGGAPPSAETASAEAPGGAPGGPPVPPEPPTSRGANSHTITASDFAEKTAAVTGTASQPVIADLVRPVAGPDSGDGLSDGPPKIRREQQTLPATDGPPKPSGERQLLPSSPRKTSGVNADAMPPPIPPAITVEEVVPATQPNQLPGDSRSVSVQEPPRPANAGTEPPGDAALSDSRATNKQANSVKLTEDKGGGRGASSVAVDVPTKQLHSLEEIRQHPLADLYSRISNEIRQYRDNVSAAWESEKLVSWTVEATSYLKSYMEAITISKSVHNSYACVEKDLIKHEARSKAIEATIESCRKGMKRESWNALREQTSSVLGSFDKIVKNATTIIEMLNKESELFDVVKSAVEDYAKNSICLIDTQSLRKSLSELKESSMKTDKEEYFKCVDTKPERSMIIDTMSDIMRIKNNCVG